MVGMGSRFIICMAFKGGVLLRSPGGTRRSL